MVSPATLQVQRGRTVEITCTVYGGSAETSIYWIQDEPERVSIRLIIFLRVELIDNFFSFILIILALRCDR